MKTTIRAPWASIWKEWVRPLMVLAILMGSFRSAVADWNDVPTGSMKPTILEGDRIFVDKLAYDLKVPFTTRRLITWADPNRGDIIVFWSPADGLRLVKRIVGLPGDQIRLEANRLLINGQAATYEPLDHQIIAQIDVEQQSHHLFAFERIGEQGHPMMLRQGLTGLDSFGPVTVAQDHYFVMGDNRDDSRDSRYIGFIARDRVLGQAKAVAISLNREKYFRPRWNRFFTRLP